jgi:hypothetical protein
LAKIPEPTRAPRHAGISARVPTSRIAQTVSAKKKLKSPARHSDEDNSNDDSGDERQLSLIKPSGAPTPTTKATRPCSSTNVSNASRPSRRPNVKVIACCDTRKLSLSIPKPHRVPANRSHKVRFDETISGIASTAISARRTTKPPSLATRGTQRFARSSPLLSQRPRHTFACAPVAPFCCC